MIQAFDAVRAKVRQRSTLVAPHQAGIADNVGSQDRRQFALLTGHGKFRAFVQRIVAGLELRRVEPRATSSSLAATHRVYSKPHSSRILALRMTLPHFSRSAVKNIARRSGVFRSAAAGSAPSARNFVCNA